MEEKDVVGDLGFYLENKNWIDGLAIAFGCQALLGIVAIEYAFARNRRFMYHKDEERDEKYAAFRRLDADRWYRFKFYPGAMFCMPARLLILILWGLISLLIGKILTCGHDYSKGPINGCCRKGFINCYKRMYCRFWMFVCGYCCPQVIPIEADYSEWLGPDYKEKYDHSVNTSMIISNHVT